MLHMWLHICNTRKVKIATIDCKDRPAADFFCCILNKTAAKAPKVAMSDPMIKPSKRNFVATHTMASATLKGKERPACKT